MAGMRALVVRAYCSHDVVWWLGCAKCEAEDDAKDPVRIDDMQATYERLDALYVRAGINRPQRDRLIDAIGVHYEQAKRWNARHAGAELGGEA